MIICYVSVRINQWPYENVASCFGPCSLYNKHRDSRFGFRLLFAVYVRFSPLFVIPELSYCTYPRYTDAHVREQL